MRSHRYLVAPDIRLDASGMLAGWAFGVPVVFLGALDIRPKRSRTGRATEEPTAWLRGSPPVLNFRTGDLFYESPETRPLQWAAALRRLTRSVQVVEAAPDRLGPGDGTLVPGAVTFELTEYSGGRAARTRRARVSQAAFERLLRTGVVV
jgi:hypothetical protein